MTSPMIQDPESYFKKLTAEREPLLLELEQEAAEEEIPIIGPVVGTLLSILTAATKAGNILELGTATGYSTLFLAKGCEASGGRITTFEMNPGLAERARKNFIRAGVDERIDIIVGDARQEMEKLAPESFDLIFLDIDKEYYFDVLLPCHNLLRKGGLLLADNVGFQDADDFNRAIFRHPGWMAVPLYAFLPDHSPEHDGLCFALKI